MILGSIIRGFFYGLASGALAGILIALIGHLPGVTLVLTMTSLGGLLGAGLVVNTYLARKRRISKVLSFAASYQANKVPEVPTFRALERDISKTPPVIVDAAVNIRSSEAHFRDNLNPENMRRLLLSIDHTSSIGH